MKLGSIWRFVRKYPLGMTLGLDKRMTDFYRTCFLSALMGQPYFDYLAKSPVDLVEIAKGMEISDVDALEAWLDFGVSVGALKKAGPSQYVLKDALAKKMASKEAEAWRAYFRLRVEVFQEHIIKTPDLLAQGKAIPLLDEHGQLYADSSRTAEPLVMDLVDETTPRQGPCRLLEVGCGSGVYLKRACEANPELTAVGVEMQASTAEIARSAIQGWGLEGRVRVLHGDIRELEPEEPFDMLTMHNLIYYFPKEERTDVLAGLKKFLKPGGRIVMSSLCDASVPSIKVMNLWTAMTQGSGALPEHEDLDVMLLKAGYAEPKSREVIPAFWCSQAVKAA